MRSLANFGGHTRKVMLLTLLSAILMLCMVSCSSAKESLYQTAYQRALLKSGQAVTPPTGTSNSPSGKE